jgi:adenylate cyclase
VFVSYASPDAALANSVVNALERNEIRCWVAPRDVVPGSLYADEIVAAINDAKIVVLVLSAHSVASPHVGKEIERASSKRRRIIVLHVDTTSLTRALEYFLSESQWIDVRGGGTETAVATLVDAVRRHLDASATGEPNGHNIQPNWGRVAAPRRKWALIGGVAILSVAFAYVVVNRFWSARNAVAGRPGAAVPLAVIPAVQPIPEKSIAVLPFVDMSERKDQEYFSDGLSEELIDMLTKIPDLRVPARTSSFYFKGKQATIVDIAKALGVTHVLEGSVRKSGKTLRVTAQLIRVDNGYHVWSETYDRKLEDIFQMQDEIAGAVVKALKISLLGGSLRQLSGTKNVEAYNLYLLAQSFYGRSNSRSDYEKVIEYLHEALKTDPQFANAWALLSAAVSLQGELDYVPLKQAVEDARHAAQHALDIDPKLPDAHTAMARVLITGDWNIEAGEAQLQEALKLDRNNSWALDWAGYLAAWKGHFNEALELVQRSITADPVNPWRYLDLSLILYYDQKYPEALAANRKMLDLNPGDQDSHHLVAMVSLATGNPAGALAEIESDAHLRTVCGCLVRALDALGRKNVADVALRELVKDHANDNAHGIGLVYASRGNIEEALGWFERAYQQHELDLFWLKVDPLLKNEQSNPRVAALLRKMGLMN